MYKMLISPFHLISLNLHQHIQKKMESIWNLSHSQEVGCGMRDRGVFSSSHSAICDVAACRCFAELLLIGCEGGPMPGQLLH